MSETATRDEELRKAFQSLGETTSAECSVEDLERVWQAVRGELPAAERRAIVARLATDPALADAWRVAAEVWRASQSNAPVARDAAVRQAWFWSPSWMGAAAALCLVVTAALAVWLTRPPAGDELREPTDVVVTSLVASDAALPRSAFTLRWTGGPAGSRYEVRVTSEDLQTVTTAADLQVPSFVVPEERLARLAAGSRVLWQVDVVTPDGERVPSRTFVTVVR